MQKLNIGCGIAHKEGYINLDWNEEVKPDILANITEDWQFQDDYFDEINADYVLGLIRESNDFLHVMNEAWRVLKSSGEFVIKVPNALFPEDAFRDPMECRWFTPNTFDHFNYNHYRWQVFKYGFKPWIIMSVEPERKTRLLVVMKPYKI